MTGVRQKPLFRAKRGFWRHLSPPKNICFRYFSTYYPYYSAFWRAFTGYFTLTLSRFMMFFVKLGFLVKNLVILYSEIRPKHAFFQMRFRNLKWLQILVLRHLPHCHIIDTWIFVRNGVKKSFLTCSLRPTIQIFLDTLCFPWNALL